MDEVSETKVTEAKPKKSRKSAKSALDKALELIERQNAALKASEARIAALEASQPSPAMLRELAEARSFLSSRAAPVHAQPTRQVTRVPYKGLVQATKNCVTDHFHLGPSENGPGDVFEVDLPALWTDDPFVPVVLVRMDDNGKPVTAPNPDAPQPIDFQFRPRTSEAMAQADAQPRIASGF